MLTIDEFAEIYWRGVYSASRGALLVTGLCWDEKADTLWIVAASIDNDVARLRVEQEKAGVYYPLKTRTFSGASDKQAIAAEVRVLAEEAGAPREAAEHCVEQLLAIDD